MQGETTAETVLVVGVGNDLLSDEGFGVHVARSLLSREAGPPSHVSVLEAGTALLDVLSDLTQYSHVVIVDVMSCGRDPGTLYCTEVTPELVRTPAPSPALSLHEWSLLETLHAAVTLGLFPKRLTLLGAEPDNLEPGTDLSPRLATARDKLVDMLRDGVLAGQAAGYPGFAPSFGANPGFSRSGAPMVIPHLRRRLTTGN
ncbi:MAG TPA: hydrogenase maturation protease [Candidatus Bathyarchaeia archaeon]|nr:hydrogenase maturation protease [Candidatus Bathyarchaeia archaeon]